MKQTKEQAAWVKEATAHRAVVARASILTSIGKVADLLAKGNVEDYISRPAFGQLETILDQLNAADDFLLKLKTTVE